MTWSIQKAGLIKTCCECIVIQTALMSQICTPFYHISLQLSSIMFADRYAHPTLFPQRSTTTLLSDYSPSSRRIRSLTALSPPPCLTLPGLAGPASISPIIRSTLGAEGAFGLLPKVGDTGSLGIIVLRTLTDGGVDGGAILLLAVGVGEVSLRSLEVGELGE